MATARATTSGSSTTIKLAAAGGILGPILFILLVVVQGLRDADYDHVALPISALAAWPDGWVQNLNFIIFGLLMAGYAAGVHRGIPPGRGGRIGPILLLLSAIGLLVAGLFPWQASNGGFIVPPGHLAGAFLAFLGAGLGLIVISRRMAGNERWRGLAAYALASGVAIVILFVVTFAFARAPALPLHPWLGLLQRVTLAVWFPCTIIIALRLLRAPAPAGASA